MSYRFFLYQKNTVNQCTNNKRLTRQVWHRSQFFLPELGYFNSLILHVLRGRCHTLLIGMAHHLLEVVRIDGVQDVEEVLARRAFANWVLVGKVLRKF